AAAKSGVPEAAAALTGPAVGPDCDPALNYVDAPEDGAELPPPPRSHRTVLTSSRIEGASARPSPPPIGMPLPAEAGDFEIAAEIGHGGMGVVYRARQKSLNRLVALKMLTVNGNVQAEALRRFRQEAGAIARLQHPHILQIFEIGTLHDRPFLA